MRITVSGLGVHYALDGPASAPVVTLSHALATSLAMWEPQVPALAQRYRVLRYDTRGHGGTETPAGPYTLEALAEDVAGLLRALGVERTHFAGLSLGGMIGQQLALQHPEMLRSLALCDTASRVPPAAQPMWEERIRTASAAGMEPHVEPTINRWFTVPFRGRRHDVVDSVRAMIRATSPAGYIGCCEAITRLDLTDRLHEIRIPTLVVVGEEDASTPVAASRTIHERIPGSQLVVLPSASHLSNLEQPEAFNQVHLGFLDKH